MKNMHAKFGSSFGRRLPVAMLATLILSVAMNAQTTLFTFQTKLPNDVTPATDVYEMEFKLFDAAAGGTQVGATNAVTAVDVKSRAFTVWLDFGAAAFPGADRFIEISYRRNSNQPFTTVALRERVLSVPYAIRSLTSGTADNALNLNGVPAGNYVQTNDPRLSDDRNPRPGSSNYIQNTAGQQTPANFNISGNGTANVLNVATQYNLSGQRILGNNGGNLTVGLGAGSLNTGLSNTFVGSNAGLSNFGGSQNTFVGNLAGRSNTNGRLNAFVGNAAGTGNTSGIQNAFFGSSAGLSNVTGNNNTFLGQSAGFANVNGKSNSFVGAFAGDSNTSGEFNTFVGSGTGTNTTTGDQNTFVGSGAGVNNTLASGNTFIGFGSTINTFTNDSFTKNNTLLGLNTKVNDGVFNSTGIGANVNVTKSNTILIGTDAQQTVMPGKVSMGGAATGGIVAGGGGFLETFDANGVSGIFTGNIVVTADSLNAVSPSDIPVCMRLQFLPPATGGNVLTRCTSGLAPISEKKDVKPFSDGIDVIKRLKPVAFNWKTDGTSDIGLNAEDVAEVAPSLIRRGGGGKIEGVNTAGLNVLFINAFKEQQRQLEAQEKTIQTQREQIKNLRQQIDAIRQLVCQTNPQAEACK